MQKHRFSKLQTYIILIGSLSFIVSCILLRMSLIYGFIGSIIFSSSILIKNGFRINEIIQMILKGLKECTTLYILVLLIGPTISIWLSSGVVPTMMYYGFEYMKSMNFLLAAFIITSIISIFMGTAVGTISTVGIALIGIGKGMGMPEHVLLGVIVSGAFIADKISPISGLLNLTLSTTKLRYREVIIPMMHTLIPTYTITAIIYYFIGKSQTSDINLDQIDAYRKAILEGFNISPYILILPLAILIMSVIGIKIIRTMLFALFSGTIFSLVFQNMNLKEIIDAIFFGYNSATGSQMIDEILVSGGMISMLEVVMIIMGAITLSSILEESGLIKPIISRVVSQIKSKNSLIMKTGIISSTLTILTCDQTVGIVLTGRVLREKYDELKTSQSILARTISDTGTIIAPLMPWNVNALIIGTISIVSASSYAPYAVLCYVSPIVSIMIGCLHKGKNANYYSSRY